MRFCDQLFRIEQELKDLSPDERKRRRQELSRSLLEAFWEWLQELRPMKNAPLNKAITYAAAQKAALSVFLQDG